LTFKDFENLLVKDFIIEKTQTKWSKNLTEGKINLLNELYTLKTTDNKRQLVYKNNKLVETKSYRINKDKTIKVVLIIKKKFTVNKDIAILYISLINM